MLDLLICNAWRPVDAWWRRAVGFADDNHPQPSGNRDSWRGNRWIRQACRFRQALAEATTDQDRVQVIADYPAIFYAHSIYEKVTPNDQAVRWGVEARLLARQSNDEIARANGCSAETIEAYEALFFNIRDRLDCRDFIFNIAIGPPPAPGLKNGVNGWLLKLFGFVGGPFVVDAMLGHIPNPLWAHTLDEVAGFFQSTTSNLVKKNAAIAALLIPIAGRTQMQIIKAFAKCMEPERTKDSPGNAQNQIQENVRSLLASLPFTTAVMAAAKQLPNCDRSAAELGTPEHLPVAVENPASDSDEVEALQFQELERVATGG